MPLKSRRSSRGAGPQKDQAHWDGGGTEAGETADAKIRRMSMQMASAERSGFRGQRAELYGGLSPATLWALRLGVLALVLGGLATMVAVFRDGGEESPSATSADPSQREAIQELMRLAREGTDAAGAPDTEPVARPYTWHRTSNEAFAPYRKVVTAFLNAASTDERSRYIIPTPETAERLEAFAGHALLEPLADATLAEKYATGDGWASVDAFVPAFGYRPLVLTSGDSGEIRIDLDGFLGYHPAPAEVTTARLKDGQQVRFRVLARQADRPAETPGDILVTLSFPNDIMQLDGPIEAVLSRAGDTPDHVIEWLGLKRFLPFTVTVGRDYSTLNSEALRIERIEADGWSSGLTRAPVVLGPDTE